MAALFSTRTPEKAVLEYSDEILRSFGSPTISRTPLGKKSTLGSAARVRTPSRSRTMTPSRIRETSSFEISAETVNTATSTSDQQASVPTLGLLNTTYGGSWCLEGFTMSKPLGKGKFGNVYHAKQKGSNVPVALKVLFKAQMQNELAQRMLKREVEIQFRLQHDNILKLYGYFQDVKNVYLILEFAEGGEYTKFLAQQGQHMTESLCQQHMSQITAGLAYMHQRHVMHRDLKPENILIDREGKLKLADLGSSVHMLPTFGSTNNSTNTSLQRYTMCGTPEYLAPEMIRCSGHNHSIDIWALGVLMYEIMFKRTPFAENIHPTQQTEAPVSRKRGRDSFDESSQMADNAEEEKENQLRRSMYHRILSFADGKLAFEFSKHWVHRQQAITDNFSANTPSSVYCQQILSLLRSNARDRPMAQEVLDMIQSGTSLYPR